MSEKNETQQQSSGRPDSFDLRRLERDPDPMQYTNELRIRNQIFRTARDLYMTPEKARAIDGIAELQAYFAVQVGGESGVYRADLIIFEQNGIVAGEPEATRIDALRTLLRRLTDHLDNWRLNLALSGQ